MNNLHDTLQQLFDTVATHLLRQGRQSVDPGTTADSYPRCLYRGPDGLKCAAGALIADEYYDPIIEGDSVHDGDVLTALGKSLGHRLTASEHNLLYQLQKLHDTRKPDQWLEELGHVAQTFSLSTFALRNSVRFM